MQQRWFVMEHESALSVFRGQCLGRFMENIVILLLDNNTRFAFIIRINPFIQINSGNKMIEETIQSKINLRSLIAKSINQITPFDELEHQHIQETLEWIKSGAPLFRIQKPDIPPKHLVSYILILDEVAKKVLLVDHRLAQLWLPPGGHVDPDEHPNTTAARECYEELAIKANFWQDTPFFLTSTFLTTGLDAGHTDVSLWYILKGSYREQYLFDSREFKSIQWFGLDEIPFDKSDPHMKRFIDKLRGILTFVP